MEKKTFIKLVKKAQKGNRLAFAELLESEKEKIYKTAWLYVRNEQDALDVVQEAVVKAIIALPSLREPAYFTTWLTRIVIRVALNILKQNQKVLPLYDFEHTAVHQLVEMEDLLDIDTAINTLDEKYRTVLILRYYHDMMVEDIAKTLKIPEGTVKTRLHRGIKMVQKKMTKEACVNE